MRKFKNPFAINGNKEIIYIKNGDVQNKAKYKECYCPECGEKLISKMGEKNVWHFSHMNNKDCSGSFETSLHLYAKEVIKNNSKIVLPELTISEYLDMNKMDSKFIMDLHKWEYENQKRIMTENFLEENIYEYKWIENEVKIKNFVPDCIVNIGGKKVAIEILVTHAVVSEKREKVKKSQIDMIEIDLSDIVHRLEEKDFNMDLYILNEASREWIYKTRVESKEEDLYYKIYNTQNYILNETYTKENLIKMRRKELEIKEYHKRLEEQKKSEKQKRIEYAIEHKEEYEKNRKTKIIRIIENYSLRKQNPYIDVCNIPVKGEYAFNCSRKIWQKQIYDKFILNREGKIIKLAKIISWIENYSKLPYFKELNYAKNEIWKSKYDAVREYLNKLEKLNVIQVLDYKIKKYSEIMVSDSNKSKADSKIYRESNGLLVCKNCGEIYDTKDVINKFYINNFGVDKNCFKEIFN